MILADKIIRLRKKNGWSQEELAEKMNVSRQAVAKWEGAQTVPALDKILQLGELFGVTTDYLLKDEIEQEEFLEGKEESNIRKVTLAEANAFLEWRKKASVQIAAATFLCIMAVIPLFLLGVASEIPAYGISETMAGVVGLGVLLVLVAVASAMFIHCGFKNAPYEFLEKEVFDTEYGVIGMVKERQKAFHSNYAKCNIIGTCICIMSPIPLFAGEFMGNDFMIVMMLSITLLIAGVGVMFFIVAGVRWASMQKLLEEGEFTKQEKRKSQMKESVSTVYWMVAVAIYLVWSFVTNDWKSTWIIWPVAGVMFAGVMVICNLFASKKDSL